VQPEDDIPGLKGYMGSDVKRLAAQYESGKFDEIHRSWLHHLPPTGASVVDIGSGSGRDACALCKRGFVVSAVEPSSDMIAEAKLLHRSSNIEWIQDHLPCLKRLVSSHRTFDLLLLSAVWMHLDAESRDVAMGTLPSLMNPGAITVITLRHPNDPSRYMFDVDPQETLRAASTHGLRVLLNETVADPVPQWGRPQVSWSLMLFKKDASGALPAARTA
jgi:2-polyprenyl-3-methyl-5-hydroxy-6-metoxy-1,4-benzoquinol methylase